MQTKQITYRIVTPVECGICFEKRPILHRICKQCKEGTEGICKMCIKGIRKFECPFCRCVDIVLGEKDRARIDAYHAKDVDDRRADNIRANQEAIGLLGQSSGNAGVDRFVDFIARIGGRPNPSGGLLALQDRIAERDAIALNRATQMMVQISQMVRNRHINELAELIDGMTRMATSGETVVRSRFT